MRRVTSSSAPAITATFGTGQPAKKKTIIPMETARLFQSSARFTRTRTGATSSGASLRNSLQ